MENTSWNQSRPTRGGGRSRAVAPSPTSADVGVEFARKEEREERNGRSWQTWFAVAAAFLIVVLLIVLVALGATGKLGNNNNNSSSVDQQDFDGTEECKVTRLQPDNGSEGLHFGSAVALQGNTAVIGAFNDDTGQGSVFVFERQNNKKWKQEATFFAGEGSTGDFFGSSLALDGDTFVLGMPYDDAHGDWSGSALVFSRSQASRNFPWTLEAELIPMQGQEHDYFGQSVALSGDTAIIGATCNVVGVNSGAAFVFTRYPGSTYWRQEAKLLPGEEGEQGAANDEFGTSVAVDGDVAIVGAWLDADNQNQSMGSVYIFRRTREGTWEQEDRLLPPYGRIDTTYGRSVTIHGDTIAVGAPGTPWNPHSMGATYVYHRQGSSWISDGELHGSSKWPYSSHNFGETIALKNDVLVVASRSSDSEPSSIDVFLRKGRRWILQDEIQPILTGSQSIGFASSIAIDGSTALVGARLADEGRHADVGATYAIDCENI